MDLRDRMRALAVDESLTIARNDGDMPRERRERRRQIRRLRARIRQFYDAQTPGERAAYVYRLSQTADGIVITRKARELDP